MQYTDEERKKINKLIKVQFSSTVEKDSSELINTELVNATAKELSFQLSFDKPTAVSMQPNSPDFITITFDKQYFTDPLTHVEINEG